MVSVGSAPYEPVYVTLVGTPTGGPPPAPVVLALELALVASQRSGSLASAQVLDEFRHERCDGVSFSQAGRHCAWVTCPPQTVTTVEQASSQVTPAEAPPAPELEPEPELEVELESESVLPLSEQAARIEIVRTERTETGR